MLHAPLSPRTSALVAAVFDADERERAQTLLQAQCGTNLPFLSGLDPVQLERYRFAAIKVSAGRLSGLERAVALAKTDWRDLLMAADFGHDVRAHEPWCDGVLAAHSALARAAHHNEQLDEKLRRTGIVDGRLFVDFAAVQSDPHASTVGWLHARLCVLAARLATGAPLSLFEPATGTLGQVTELAELVQWADRHFPIACFRP